MCNLRLKHKPLQVLFARIHSKPALQPQSKPVSGDCTSVHVPLLLSMPPQGLTGEQPSTSAMGGQDKDTGFTAKKYRQATWQSSESLDSCWPYQRRWGSFLVCVWESNGMLAWLGWELYSSQPKLYTSQPSKASIPSYS